MNVVKLPSVTQTTTNKKKPSAPQRLELEARENLISMWECNFVGARI